MKRLKDKPSSKHVLAVVLSVELQPFAVASVLARDVDLVVLHVELLRVGDEFEGHVVLLDDAFADRVQVHVTDVLDLQFELALRGAERCSLDVDPATFGYAWAGVLKINDRVGLGVDHQGFRLVDATISVDDHHC